jgi:hypothetical protein
MAVIEPDAEDFDVIARMVMFGPRGTRLQVVNVFRVANSKSAIEYLVNHEVPSQEEVDDATNNLSDGASGGSISGDTADMETVFTAALFGPRENRINVVNIAREGLGLDPVEYLVNSPLPHQGAFDAAMEDLEALL